MIGVVDVSALVQPVKTVPATTSGVPIWAWMLGGITVASVAVLLFVPPPRRWR